MNQTADLIEQHLDHERRALQSNLEELEDRVRSTVDWRRQFRRNTAAFLGLACGVGLLIGLMAARRSGRSAPAGKPATVYSDHRRRELSLAWRSIESALIGLAAAKLKDGLANMLPGFREQLAGRERDGYRRDRSTRYRG